MDLKNDCSVLCIVINGSACAGKDTLVCSLVDRRYNIPPLARCLGRMSSGAYIYNISSVDNVKAAATMLGWDNRFKTASDRIFLHELKECSIKYNDGPTSYVIEFLRSVLATCSDNCSYVFVHIREPEEIDKLKVRVSSSLKGVKFRTLLVDDTSDSYTFVNGADDVVHDYTYDVVFSYNKLNDMFETTVKRFHDVIQAI